MTDQSPITVSWESRSDNIFVPPISDKSIENNPLSSDIKNLDMKWLESELYSITGNGKIINYLTYFAVPLSTEWNNQVMFSEELKN